MSCIVYYNVKFLLQLFIEKFQRAFSMEDEDDEYKILSIKNLIPSIDQTSSGLWNKRQKIKWNITLFFGCFLLYSSRTSMSICSVEIAKEYGWDKSLTVNKFVVKLL